MAAATRGYRMILIMPEHLSVERRQTMRAFGAEIILTPQKGGMEAARDLADRMVREGKGTMLDQFANPDNPLAHYETTARRSGATPTAAHALRLEHGHHRHHHGLLALLQGEEPEDPGDRLPARGRLADPGIRKWPEAYLPKIYDKARVDRLEYVSQAEAEEMTRRMAREEGIFAGISSGGAMHVALRIARELKNAVVVTIVCDRGDRYLTTGVFPD
jgi:cysteine synthase B